MRQGWGRVPGAVLALTVASALSSAGAAAQFREPGQPAGAPTSWPPVSVGLRVGYDQGSRGETVGVHVHIPVLPEARIELMPSADVTFLTALREYQLNVEAVYVTSGRSGGLYLGGGLAFRNSIYGSDPSTPRSTERGYTAVVGVRTMGSAPFGIQFEARWTFLDVDVRDPRTVSLGVNFPLWGRTSGQS